MTIERYGDRYWAVYDSEKNLICVTVYKKGAKEVIKRLQNYSVHCVPQCSSRNDSIDQEKGGEIDLKEVHSKPQ